MITEDYVSFETAKLLKEKGFNIPCRFNYRSMYPNIPKPFYHKSLKDFNGKEYEGLRSEWFSAPTQQLAMKWLRLFHGIFIQAYCPVADMESEKISDVKYNVVISNLKNHCLAFDTPLEDNEYDSPEEAYEDAIKYCLENLI